MTYADDEFLFLELGRRAWNFLRVLGVFAVVSVTCYTSVGSGSCSGRRGNSGISLLGLTWCRCLSSLRRLRSSSRFSVRHIGVRDFVIGEATNEIPALDHLAEVLNTVIALASMLVQRRSFNTYGAEKFCAAMSRWSAAASHGSPLSSMALSFL